MPRVAIVTDSTADLPPRLSGEYDITVVPLTVIFGDESFRDGVDLTGDDFIHRLRESPHLPTTSQPTPDDFAAVYRSLARDHDVIVSVHIAAALSGTLRSAMTAAQLVSGEIPVMVRDSGSASMGTGFQAISAARLARGGASITDIAAELDCIVPGIDAVFVVDSLDYLRRGGRIGRARAMLGSLLDIKPTLRLANGAVSPLERTRTRTHAIRGMVNYVKRQGKIRRICTVHAGDVEDAADVLRAFDLLASREEMYVAQLGAVIATHTGPGTLGLIFERDAAPS